MTNTSQAFSVLMSLHAKDKADLLDRCLDSLTQQKLHANQVVLVFDGPIDDCLKEIIKKYSAKLPFHFLQLTKNMGLGTALQNGLSACHNDLIARVDADDISMPGRFLAQVNYMNSNSNIDLVGTVVMEFEDTPENIISEKRVPLTSAEIARTAKWRNPINHMSVMFRRSAVLRAGGYSNRRYAQDYELWVRMLHSGSLMANLEEPLVLVSAGQKMIARRGGWDYFLNEFDLQMQFLRMGFVSPLHLLFNSIARLSVRILPGHLRAIFYHYILRKKVRSYRCH